MAGISSNASLKKSNKDQTFQSQKFDDDLGISLLQFKWRNHDPQIGRFYEIDPLSNSYLYNSTYAFSENKVVRHIELEGLEAIDPLISNNRFVRNWTKTEPQKRIESFNKKASEALEIKGSVGIEAGFTLGVGKTKLEIGASALQLEGKANLKGEYQVNGALAGVGGSVSSGVDGAKGKIGAQLTVGNIEIKNGIITTSAVDYNAGGDINTTKKTEIKDGKVSEEVEGNWMTSTLTFGAKFGVVGFEVSLNVVKAGMAILDFAGAVKEFTVGTGNEMVPLSPNNRQALGAH